MAGDGTPSSLRRGGEAGGAPVLDVDEDLTGFRGKVYHHILLYLLVVAVGATIPISTFTGAAVGSKELHLDSVHDAESTLVVVGTAAVAAGHVLAGIVIKDADMLHTDSGHQTKPIFFVGLLCGIIGLVTQWVAQSMVLLVVAQVLVGVMNGLCGTALLILMMYRFGSRHKATAVGTYMALNYGLAELIGGAIGGLVIGDATECERSCPGGGPDSTGTTERTNGAWPPPGGWSSVDTCTKDSTITHEQCVDMRLFQLTSNGLCTCTGFRPSGSLFQVGCLVVAILLGLLYTDKHLNASPVGDSPGPARTASATVAGERRYKSNEQGAVEATEGHSFPQLTVFMLWQDQVLRVALVTLMGGGLIAGGLVALMLGLNNHTLGRDLKTSISPNEERAILVANLVAINIFSVLMGICSDRVNRKSFVLAGLGLMVLSAVLGASAIDYQTHFAFRRGELFVASLFSGVGAATMFGAAVAAVVDRAHRIWRAFAVGMAMTSWEVGRMLGFIFVDKILRGYEMLGVGVIVFVTFLVGLFFVVVYQDERDELGAQEEADVAEESSDEEDGAESVRTPRPTAGP